MFVVHGSYFANNFGDTLLVKLMCDEIAEQVGKENVYLAFDGHKVEQNNIGYPVLPKEKRKQATHLVFAGGGYFGEPPEKGVKLIRWYLRNYFRHSYWLKDYPNAKVGVFGVGYGPLSIPILSNLLIEPLKRANVILLRDEESIEFFKERIALKNKIPKLCVDFALSLKKTESIKEKKIALHVPNLNYEGILEVVNGINHSKMKGFAIDFILDAGSRFSNTKIKSIEKALESANYLGCVGFISYDDVDSLLDRLSKYSLVITSKLHVGIVTTALGGKVISIPKHPKTKRFYSQIGLEKFCITYKTFDADKICKLINELDDYEPEFEVIKSGIEKIKDEIKLFCGK